MRNELLAKLEEVLKEDNVLSAGRAISAMIRDYKSILSDEKYLGKDPDGDLTEEEQAELKDKNEKDNSIAKLLNEFNDKRKAAQVKLAEELKTNYLKKKEILKSFANLVENEENIGESFSKRKEIQQKWAEVGKVAADKFESIQKEYSRLSDSFNYNINLYKAIKDHDLKRNFSLKNQVIFQLKELTKEPSIKKVQDELNVLMSQWDEIGPTFKEEWDKLKDTYWDTIKQLREKVNVFYEDRRKSLDENLGTKLDLIARAKEITEEKFNSIKAWNESSNKLSALQDEWKKTGAVVKEKNEEVWKEFRSIFDAYYADKKEYFAKLRSESNENIKRKKAIVAKAQELKASDLWKETTQDLVRLQNNWKKIGHAGKSEQKLWQDFRAACDEFFNAKKNYFDTREDVEKENLAAKESLIEKIKAFKPVSDANESINKLKEFASQFNDIGNVPFKVKDTVYKAYKTALDNHYDKLKIDKKERENMFFKDRLEGIFSKSNASSLLKQEKDKLSKKLTQIKSDVLQYENNLGFFGNSKGAEALMADVKKKINRAKSDMEAIKSKLSIINKKAKEQ